MKTPEYRSHPDTTRGEGTAKSGAIDPKVKGKAAVKAAKRARQAAR